MKIKNGSPFIFIGFGLGLFWWFFESIVHVVFFGSEKLMTEIFTNDSEEIWMRLSIVFIFTVFGLFAHVTLKRLQDAQNEIKILNGLLPICAGCKKIRDEKGLWNSVESYITTHSEAHFTHGICPECNKKLYQDLVFE